LFRIITFGAQVLTSSDAVDILEKEDGLQVEVTDLRTLAPMDVSDIKYGKKPTRALVLHEASRWAASRRDFRHYRRRSFEWLDAPPTGFA